MKKIIVMTFCFSLALTACTQGQHQSTSSSEQQKIAHAKNKARTLKAKKKTEIVGKDLPQAMAEMIDKGQSVGMVAVLVDKNKSETIKQGVLKKDSEIKVNEKTQFSLGSISKVFTDLLLADMVVRGQISLDDPIDFYLPEGVAPNFEGQKITLWHLATHTSALPEIPGNYVDPRTKPANPYSQEQMYAFLRNYQLPQAPGTTITHSNFGTSLLGHILEIKSGKPYSQLLAERITTPLGMSQTKIKVDPDAKNIATGHEQLKPLDPVELPEFMAGGKGILSTAEDMMKFLQAQMGVRQSRLSRAIKLSQTLQFDDEKEKVALGWFVEGDIYKHDGSNDGFKSFIGFDKTKQKGIVLLSNSDVEVSRLGEAYLMRG